jgi:hypothetical protein
VKATADIQREPKECKNIPFSEFHKQSGHAFAVTIFPFGLITKEFREKVPPPIV